MFKFLRRNKQQPEEPSNRPESEVTTDDQAVDHLEEVLRPLFETIKPTAPGEYVGTFVKVTLTICYSKVTTVSKYISLYIPDT